MREFIGAASKKEIEELKKQIKELKMSRRYKLERYLDTYNHFMELIRTLTGLTVLVLQIIILLSLW